MEPEVIDLTEFLAYERGLLIAPAGHGKTTAIADCLNLCPDDTCQLVLTHTHAGIASLKKKFKEKKVPSHKYQLETITGFAQRYVLAFIGATALPKPEEKAYFSTAVAKCIDLLNTPVLQHIIKLSFNGIFVDEYQDCTISQHNMILALAQNLPLHILGDPLQGIFDFENEKLVNFDNDLSGIFGFKVFNLLNYPWRWHKTNEGLGLEIMKYRKLLLGDRIDIQLLSKPENGIYVEYWSNPQDHYSSEYIKWIYRIIHKYESKSTLILCPSYHEMNNHGVLTLRGDLKDRIRIKEQFDYSNSYLILDAIDGGTYYTVSKKIDQYISQCTKHSRIDPIKHLFDLLCSLYVSKTFLAKWISKTKKGWRFKVKKNNDDKAESERIRDSFNKFKESPSLNSFLCVLHTLKSMRGYSNHRPDFWGEIIICAKHASEDGTTLYNAMNKHRSRIRHMGRKIGGKCIGTTLLTKGLEFDTVILLNADKFEDKNHFYVAISRACRNLIFITQKTVLTFN